MTLGPLMVPTLMTASAFSARALPLIIRGAAARDSETDGENDLLEPEPDTELGQATLLADTDCALVSCAFRPEAGCAID